jgi:Arc/MetJ-type ribon-helix-helix transcriptional regulator
MTIHLSKELEQIVHDAVRSGRYAHEVDVIRDALIRLKQTMSEGTQSPSKRAKPAQPKKQPLTEADVLQHMLDIGLITQLPDTAADFDDPDDQPITIKGEPLSETVIRERR